MLLPPGQPLPPSPCRNLASRWRPGTTVFMTAARLQDSSLSLDRQIVRSRIKEKANQLIRRKNNPLCRQRQFIYSPTVGMMVHFMCVIYTFPTVIEQPGVRFFPRTWYLPLYSTPCVHLRRERAFELLLGAPSLLNVI